MSVIITSGLRQEWCDFGQSRMMEMGVIEADDATRIDLSAEELVHKMCKSLKVSAQRSNSFRQVKPGKTWQIARRLEIQYRNPVLPLNWRPVHLR